MSLNQSNLRVYVSEIPDHSDSLTSIPASRTTRAFEILQRTLDKLHIESDQSQYSVYVGINTVKSSWQPIDVDDFPIKFLDQLRKQQPDPPAPTTMNVIISKRSMTISDQLNALIGSGGPSQDASTGSGNISDLCLLDNLSESVMLNTLQSRFTDGHIYTYIGSILIAINPYHRYPIYNPKYSNDYQNQRLGQLPPHIFAIADDAYNRMLTEKQNQSVIISGESGAGKTESTKFLLHQLMKLSSKLEENSSLEFITLGTGPVLEAFGNAKTVANDNSSRFGKFILLKFKQNGGYFGASIEKYLLEKSRIVSQASGERNYHVFYYLLNGASSALKSKLHLLNTNEYHYLGQRTIVPLDGIDETSEFNTLRESLIKLGFSTEIQMKMFAVLSAILHIGNIQFEKNIDSDSVCINDSSAIDVISELLNVSKETLSEALTSRKSQIRGDSIITPYTMNEAIATRDALSKALYGALFDWIVAKVNASLALGLCRGFKGNTIGVLDIFGFEVFQKNSFEQFCINYANEQLQQYFNRHIFKLEQEDYQKEGIQWESVEFVDNSECLELIAKKPTGLLCLLDEECSLSGTDSSLYAKFDGQHKNNTFYSSPRMKQINPVFTVLHYASEVTYSIKGFLEKNRDLMRQDVIDVLATSKMDLVRAFICPPVDPATRWHVAFTVVLAVIYFKQKGAKKSNHSNDTTDGCLDPSTSSTTSTLTTSPIMVSGKGSRRGSSEAFSFEHSTPMRTKIGLGLTRVYDVTIGDTVAPDASEGSHRRPSIANLLKIRKQRPLKSRVQEENKGSLTKSLSIPRLKSDDVRPGSPSTKVGGASTGPGRRGQLKTVSAQFHMSLVSLMEQLERTNPYFIRCIKSNKEKAPKKFDPDLVTRQLRYTGIMETVRIRKSGFPIRMTFEDFYCTYKLLMGEQRTDLSNQITEFLWSIGFDSSVLQIGNTKVFMRNSQKCFLDQHFWNTIVSKIIRIQRWVRAKLDRCRYLHMKRVALQIQTIGRGWIARNRFSDMQKRLSSAVIIQSYWRSIVCRQHYMKLRVAAILIQASWRGLKERRRYKVLLAEHKLKEKKDKPSVIPPHVQLRKKRSGSLQRPLSDTVSSAVCDEISLALMDFDLMLDEEMKKTNINDSNEGPMPDSPLRESSTSSLVSETSPNILSPKSQPVLKKNVKDLISQIQRSSVSPSPPPLSPTSPTFILPTSSANVKNIINKMQSSPTSPKPDKTPPTRKSLASDRISQFMHDNGTNSDKQKQTTPVVINRIKSPFLMMENNSQSTTQNTSLAVHTRYQKFQKSLKRSKSHGDLVQQQQDDGDEDDVMVDHEGPSSQDKTGLNQSTSHDNHVIDDRLSHYEDEDNCQVFDIDNSTSEDNDVNSLSLKRPLRRAGGPMKRKHITKRTTPPPATVTSPTSLSTPPVETLLPVSLAEVKDKELLQSTTDISSEDEEEIGSTAFESDLDKGERSKSALPVHTQSLNVPNLRAELRSKTSPRREIKSVGDNYEIDKENNSDDTGSSGSHLVEESHEFTADLSVDSLDHLNYQWRHSVEPGERSSNNSSPSNDKERFIVTTKKKWIKSKSPVKSLRIGGTRKEPHPLISKIQRIGSPVSSGESGTNTPVLGTSPLKHQRTKRNGGGDSSISSPVSSMSCHSFKTTSVARGQVCIVCNSTFSGFLKYGSKCVACGIVVHKHCQERSPVCEYTPGSMIKKASEVVINNVEDLKELADFLVEKHHMHSHQLALLDQTEYRQVDRVFQMALSEFHVSLLCLSLQEESSSDTKNNKSGSMTFEKLVNKFTNIYRGMAKREELLLDACDISIGINQIRTFIDEFVKTRQQVNNVRLRTFSNETKNKPRLLRRKKTEKDSNIKVHKNHRFKLTQFNLVTVCDQCSTPILVLQKGEVCEVCSYSCHENCMKKINLKCEGKGWREASNTNNECQFGVSLQVITPKNEANIPVCLEKCLSCIENNGLYTQGIYRKSAGGTSRRAVREALEKDPIEADLDSFSLYAIAATVTSFFRELPEPLLTRGLYMDFIRATEISDTEELLHTLHQIINKLPDINHDVFERLVFHLARVAEHQSDNKMDPHNLAIIFAPNLLQGHQGLEPQELLSVMPKQTLVLEVIIAEQMTKLTATLRGIRHLSSKERKTASRLSKLMANQEKSPPRNISSEIVEEEGVFEERGIDIGGLDNERQLPKQNKEDESVEVTESEKKLLTVELEQLQKERAILTASLPKLEPYSPLMDNPTIQFPPSSSSRLSSASLTAPPTNTGPGMDEFLRRQSMFANTHSSSYERSVSPIIAAGKKKEELIVRVEEVHKEEPILPDLPPTQLLKPLTKNRVSKPPVARKRRPNHTHKTIVDNLSTSPLPAMDDDDTLYESPL